MGLGRPALDVRRHLGNREEHAHAAADLQVRGVQLLAADDATGTGGRASQRLPFQMDRARREISGVLSLAIRSSEAESPLAG